MNCQTNSDLASVPFGAGAFVFMKGSVLYDVAKLVIMRASLCHTNARPIRLRVGHYITKGVTTMQYFIIGFLASFTILTITDRVLLAKEGEAA